MDQIVIDFARTNEGRQIILIIAGFICCIYQFIFSLLRGASLKPIVDRFAILILLLCVSLPIIAAFEGRLIAWFFNAITGLKILFLLLTAVESSNAWSGSDGYLVKLLKKALTSAEKKFDDKINKD